MMMEMAHLMYLKIRIFSTLVLLKQHWQTLQEEEINYKYWILKMDKRKQDL
jgi:hypothetical protein